MIDVKRLRQDPAGTRASLMRRGDPSLGATLDDMLELDRQRRELLVRVESLKAERNAASDEVARRKRAKESADDLMERLESFGRGGASAGPAAARDRSRAGRAGAVGAEFPGR